MQKEQKGPQLLARLERANHCDTFQLAPKSANCILWPPERLLRAGPKESSLSVQLAGRPRATSRCRAADS